jgi:DNA-binding MltR family transcriptional regulator
MVGEESQVDPQRDLGRFLDEMQKESPRAAVILSAAFLDENLRSLLAGFLIDQRSATDGLLDVPLGSFSARITAAYCLGLISQHERDDLDLIRKVRNQFAHRLHNLTFDDAKIVAWCNSLNLPGSLPSHYSMSHGDRFRVAVALLSMRLSSRAISVRRERRVVREEPKVVPAVPKDARVATRTLAALLLQSPRGEPGHSYPLSWEFKSRPRRSREESAAPRPVQGACVYRRWGTGDEGIDSAHCN